MVYLWYIYFLKFIIVISKQRYGTTYWSCKYSCQKLKITVTESSLLLITSWIRCVIYGITG